MPANNKQESNTDIASFDEETVPVADENEEEGRLDDEVEAPEVQESLDVALPEVSKTSRFFRRLLRWTVGLFVVFSLGVIAALQLRYQPVAEELSQTRAELNEAQTEVADLESQIESQNEELEDRVDELSTLKEDNQSLNDELARANIRILLLSVLADVHAAQFALAVDDPANAQLQLANTREKLESLQDNVNVNQKDEVGRMIARLELVSSEIDTDSDLAQDDLEALANSLIRLENEYFSDS